jgi:hypothetical protein
VTAEWLKFSGYDDFSSLFRESGWDLQTILQLQEEQVTKMGEKHELSWWRIEKVWKFIEKYKRFSSVEGIYYYHTRKPN